jgi:hypothetical protein
MIKQELAYWEKVGPGLKPGWWNGGGLQWNAVEGLRNHYSRVHAALQGLKSIRFAGCRDVVTKFRAFCVSVPHLGEIVQLTEQCDAVLAALPKP